MNNLPLVRTKASDLQNMNIVIAHGVVENRKDVCTIGWVEDRPHDGESALLINEPLTCVFSGNQICFLAPSWGLPATAEIFEYTRVDVYEGITTIAALYLEHVIIARQHRPIFEAKFIPESALNGTTQQQKTEVKK